MGIFSGLKKKKEKRKYGSLAEEYDQDINYDKLSGEDEEQYVNTRQQKLIYAENCCDQMLLCQRRMEEAKKEYREVNHYLEDIVTIENLEPGKKKDLLREAQSIISLTEDKRSYKNASVKMSDKKFEFIATHEKEMPEIMKNLKEYEEDLAAIKRDLHNVEGEKSALKYERNMSIRRMNGLRKLLKMVLAFAAILLGLFTYGQFYSDVDYSIGYYIVITVAVAIIAIILVSNQTHEKNMKIAELKLNKVIGILNKCKIRYVNVKSSVDYLYATYGVANSYELINLWQNYLTAKKEREAYFTMSDNLYKATNNYMHIINSLDLYDPSVWNYQMAALLDENEMKVIKDTLHGRRDSLKKTIDYNNDMINKSKDRIKSTIEADKSLADDIIAMVDRKEKELLY